jgi:hypothetical protein
MQLRLYLRFQGPGRVTARAMTRPRKAWLAKVLGLYPRRYLINYELLKAYNKLFRR